MHHYDKLVIDDPQSLRFGVAPHPVRTRRGMIIGGGTVYPELNFTLPAITIDAGTMPEVRRQYREMVSSALARAAELEAPGVVVELETLPPMCQTPSWGVGLAEIVLEEMEKVHRASGLPSVLRMTPNDLREMSRPPLMRRGEHWAHMMETFEGSAALGAELLSIESTGGKEVSDEALTSCDLGQMIFALCVLGVRDMRFLWTEIAKVAARHGVHAAGDTACGFANTAMVLAEKRYIPRVFAAVVRAVSAVRSLVAYECGAVGPGKDCGYENVFLKAITGAPMAMEGKTAACAHLSPLGNIAGALADTWSNESVQNVKLLAAMAPTCYMEQLVYDCRLMNTASKKGDAMALALRDCLVESDAALDPQAYILRPDSVIAIAKAIVAAPDAYAAGRAAAAASMSCIREGFASGALAKGPREVEWLGRLEDALGELPATEGAFVERMLGEVSPGLFLPAEYGL
jgi:methanol---5-hydroxybenzimidazolylcobamide Co-methyltransferase